MTVNCRVWVVADAVEGPIPAAGLVEALTPALTLARDWGGGVRVLLFADTDVPPAQTDALVRRGATHVTLLRCPDFARDESLSRVDAIDRVLAVARPQVLLVAAESRTAWWPVYLTARRRLPVATRCLDVWVRGDHLGIRREALNASVQASYEFTVQQSLPIVLVLERGSWNAAETTGSPTGAVETLTIEPTPAGGVTRIRRILPGPGDVDLEDAEIVLAGGAGLRDVKTFAALRELARLLEAAVGASRVAVDAGWARAEEQVGLTGRRVAPVAYLAFGISGSREHLAGVSDARAVVAVNTDPSAPIARASRLFAVSDAGELLRALGAEARRRLEAAEKREAIARAGA